jgi:hypothetical protein
METVYEKSDVVINKKFIFKRTSYNPKKKPLNTYSICDSSISNDNNKKHITYCMGEFVSK